MLITELLQRCELFSGLTPEQIEQVATLCQEVIYNTDDIIIHEGGPADAMYIIHSGTVAVLVSAGMIPDVAGPPQLTPLVRLGQGQFFGEMALVDYGARSATVRCIENNTVVYVISRQDFWDLCDGDHHIGYIVMRNIAFDLSFKLRHRNLQVRLAGGEA
ncbi:MAG: cyclic nucleotide-binding domain-containing protein [Chloroflexota bacterium]|nr:cyclic nucleotide-binding domain-containing protein [Chloroflexota bacterium]